MKYIKHFENSYRPGDYPEVGDYFLIFDEDNQSNGFLYQKAKIIKIDYKYKCLIFDENEDEENNFYEKSLSFSSLQRKLDKDEIEEFEKNLDINGYQNIKNFNL